MPGDPDGRAERASWLHIALTPGIGPVAAARLLAALGLPEDILGTSLSLIHISEPTRPY